MSQLKQNALGQNGDIASSDFQAMQAAYCQLSKIFKQLVGTMDIANRLYCINQLSTAETKGFTSAMTEVTECLVEWQGFFSSASERSRAHDRRASLIDLNDEPLSGSGEINCFQGLQDQDVGISGSPLVTSKSQQAALFPLTPLHRPSKKSQSQLAATDADSMKLPTASTSPPQVPVIASPAVVFPMTRTPPLAAAGSEFSAIPPIVSPGKKPTASPPHPVGAKPSSPSTESSPPSVILPLPRTPAVKSALPDASTSLKSAVQSVSTDLKPVVPDAFTTVSNVPPVESPVSCPPQEAPQPVVIKDFSPAGRASMSSPESMELVTPRPHAEFLMRYAKIFESPEVTSNRTTDPIPETPMPETPNFGKFPPRTCKPLKLLENGLLEDSDFKFSTPILSTPYSTPGSVFSPLTPFTISKSSEPLVDDMTTSAIKRIGVKGLEEELWRKLKAWNIDTNLNGGAYTRLRLSRRTPKTRPVLWGKENKL